MEPMSIDINGHFAVGATGAVGTLVGRGITSVTRNSEGLYTILLDDVYSRFEGFTCNILHATELHLRPQLISQAVATKATRTVVFSTFDADDSSGVDDPPSGSTVYFTIKVKNTGA